MSLILTERPLTHASLNDPEATLRFRAANLGLAQLETEVWEDLHKALDAAASGRTGVVARWIDTVEGTFLDTWEGYEASDLLVEEITTESVLGHLFLREGVESWLEALELFREGLNGTLDRSAILHLAEAGQRLLLVVQIVKQEAHDSVSRFIAAWAN